MHALSIHTPLVVIVLASLSTLGCSAKGSTTQSAPSFVTVPDVTKSSVALKVTKPTAADKNAASTRELTCQANPKQFRTTFIDLINKARAKPRQCGDTSYTAAAPLRWNAQLATAAERHSLDMSDNNFFDHTGTGNTSVGERVNAANYAWQSVGENLAAGQLTLQEAIEGWLSSPGHCRNIMNTRYKEAGLACVENQSTEFSTYWTNVFGAEFQ